MAPLGFSTRPALVRHNVEHNPLALPEALAAKRYLSILYGDNRLILRAGPPARSLLTLDEVSPLPEHLEQVLLGEYHDVPVIATLLPKESMEPFEADTAFHASDLRSIATSMILPESEIGLLAAAKSLLSWHERHRFCSNCGNATTLTMAGFRRDCSSCNGQHFPRTDPVAIMLITRGDLCLLGRSPHFEQGRFSCLAGFIEPGETIEAAVRRETYEETGIHVGSVTYLQSQPWPFPSNLMIGMHGIAESEEIVINPTEIEAARWFSKREVQQMFDGNHPDGLHVPPPVAIAHHLLRHFLES